MFLDEFTIVFNRFQRPFLNKILDALIIQNIKRTSKISSIIRYSNCNLYILIMNQEGLNQFNRLEYLLSGTAPKLFQPSLSSHLFVPSLFPSLVLSLK